MIQYKRLNRHVKHLFDLYYNHMTDYAYDKQIDDYEFQIIVIRIVMRLLKTIQ